MATKMRISVRELVEFLLRSGDIDNRAAGPTDEMMLEGSRMHRRLQKAAGPDYMAEVPLSIYYPIPADENFSDTIDLLIEGRADGIFMGVNPAMPILGEMWTIDEIKSTYRNLSKMREPEPVHLAQACCYAYIYAVQNDLQDIRVRMTYASLLTGETRMFWRDYGRAQIEAWFDGLIADYSKWARMQARWIQVRTESLKALDFPFPYRDGQRELAVYVYRTIVHGRKLFLEAPTGSGKTLATVFPALKAMGEGKADKIFYLTARTVTGRVAEDTFSLLRRRGMRLRSLTLTAKEKICPFEELRCDPEHCPRAAGHFDRVNEALFALASNEEQTDRGTVGKYASEYCVCPFELELDASLFADAVLGDYNYLFDPHARLHRFFAGGAHKGSYLFLIDEAHNLVSRGREMYSAQISGEQIAACRKAVRRFHPALWKKLGKLEKRLRELRDLFGEDRDTPAERAQVSHLQMRGADGDRPVLVLQEVDEFAGAACGVQAEMKSILQEQRKRGLRKSDARSKRDSQESETLMPGGMRQDVAFSDPDTAADLEGTDAAPAELNSSASEELNSQKISEDMRRSFLGFFFVINHFLMIYEGMGEDYRIYLQKSGGRNTGLTLYCVDPSGKLAECMDAGKASILFSATFLPIRYYKKLLGGTGEDYEVYAKSVFDPEKRGVFIAGDVTSRYRDRGQEQYIRIADCIYHAVSQRHGNYLIFFPSYAFMESVLEQYRERYPESGDIRHIVQRENMSEAERTQFLQRFEEVYDDRSLLGFAVLGGIFSEGIDLRRDRLIGVLIVGTGFPRVCAQREILRQYFDEKGENGFDYAYRFPGMNKVLQAAGRVIRTPEDVGIVILLDGRFGTYGYRRLFPAEWKNVRLVSTDEMGERVSRFWDEWL